MASNGAALSNRSSSPVTKRPAADMDGLMDGASDERSDKAVSLQKPKAKETKHKRIVSVDMIKEKPEDALDQAALFRVPQARSTPISNRDSKSAGISPPSTLRSDSVPL